MIRNSMPFRNGLSDYLPSYESSLVLIDSGTMEETNLLSIHQLSV